MVGQISRIAASCRLHLSGCGAAKTLTGSGAAAGTGPAPKKVDILTDLEGVAELRQEEAQAGPNQ
jgi:hypothetical protein